MTRVGHHNSRRNNGDPEPYSNPRRLILDVTQNNHIFVNPTREAYGDTCYEPDHSNPLLAEVPGELISGEVPLANDILRIVHDYFGHTREGLGFRSEGEYNAWRGHLAMYSPLARSHDNRDVGAKLLDQLRPIWRT
ncbi:hypothetical protein ColTof4_14089 [Colletotrichum tofieldiae]|nr:hypothetical protein ColTof3_02995 [Colletotrichum tofieldiae]GKT81666.1 hypothetical protein ColTof4_14089 [Colletotrichum tofieldiae]